MSKRLQAIPIVEPCSTAKTRFEIVIPKVSLRVFILACRATDSNSKKKIVSIGIAKIDRSLVPTNHQLNFETKTKGFVCQTD